MEKVRVYELAKEMNTTSKRLMEKLGEINVVVKNHMSLLEDHELEALYKHIGVIKHDDKKANDQKAEHKASDSRTAEVRLSDQKAAEHKAAEHKAVEHKAAEHKAVEQNAAENKAVENKAAEHKPAEHDDKKTVPGAQPHQKAEHKKDVKSAPRIIRTTEIYINSKNDSNNSTQQQYSSQNYNQRGDVRNNQRNDSRRDYVRTSDSNSGLRAGFVRDSQPDYSRLASRQESSRDGQKINNTVNNSNTSANVNITKDVPKNTIKDTVKDQPKEMLKEITKNEDSLQDAKLEVATAPAMTENADRKSDELPKAEIKNAVTENQPESIEKPQAENKTDNDPVTTSIQGQQVSEKKTETNQGSDRPQYQQGTRPPYQQGDRPQYQQGNRPPYQQGDRPQYQQGNRPPYQQGDRPQYQQGNRPTYQQGDRPQYQQGDRPQYQQGDRPQYQQGDRPQNQQGDRPQYQQSTRPPYQQGDRPQYQQGTRPPYQQGDRPQYQQGTRPPYQQGDRPQYQQGTRPPYQQGDRPQYQQGTRPPYQQGDRPQYQQGTRPPYQQGDRPQYQQGTRPPYQQGDRPQYQQGNRPPYQQGDRPQYQQGNRPPYQQGDRPQYNRTGDRNQQGSGGYRQGGGGRQMDIPKPELSIAQKEELSSQKSEIRREFSNKDQDRDVKREQKREIPKGQAAAKNNNSNTRFKPHTVALGEKKGVSEVLSEDFILNEFYSDDAKKKRTSRPRKDMRNIAPKYIPARAVLSSVTLPETITVKDLAEALKKTSTEVIKKLMMNYGMMATLNQEIDFDTATLIADEFGVKTEKEVVVNEEDILFDDSEVTDETKLIPRPPVVVVMGHVDHGKTSLLDAIRSANVTDSEAGGITQHIGAYMVKINNRNITFLDTPGHEAFTAMRARGAQVTDIAILVVAADDGVMPQTIEAINHAKAANVSIIVAINKTDKPGANPEKVKQELTQHGLVSEEWGGDVICVNVSAKKHENIDQLLEMVLLTADVLELKSDPDKQAKGTVVEAKLDKNRGPLATVLVQRGTLNVGDSIVTGTTVGRIRAMNDDKGNSVKTAGPSTPVEILGLPDVPEAGEVFYAIKDEKVARQLAEKRKFKLREKSLKVSSRVTLEDLYSQIKEGKVKDLNLIVKADVQGSVEAVKQSLEKLSNDEVRIKIIHGGVGAITETDVALAGVSNAIIIGFNVRPGPNVAEAAQNSGVDMRLYSIIYKAIEDIQAAMKGMLEPTYKEVIQGHAEVRQTIKVSNVGTIAGCYVTDGKITRNSDVRILRDGIVVHTGKLASLKRFKDDAKEVAQGYECGASIDKYNDIKEGDVVESYIMEEVAR